MKDDWNKLVDGCERRTKVRMCPPSPGTLLASAFCAPQALASPVAASPEPWTKETAVPSLAGWAQSEGKFTDETDFPLWAYTANEIHEANNKLNISRGIQSNTGWIWSLKHAKCNSPVFVHQLLTVAYIKKQTKESRFTLMSLVKACISVVNSTHCSSSCCCFCISLLSFSFSALVSFTELFSIWIWSCWSWISFRFSSILLEAAKTHKCYKQAKNRTTKILQFLYSTMCSWGPTNVL